MSEPRQPEYWEEDEVWDRYREEMAKRPAAPPMSRLEKAVERAQGKSPEDIEGTIAWLNAVSGSLCSRQS